MTVTAVRLADGTVLEPSYLFDASNHGRVLGTAMGQKRRLLGEPQPSSMRHDAPSEHDTPRIRPVVVTHILPRPPTVEVSASSPSNPRPTTDEPPPNPLGKRHGMSKG